MSDEHNKKSDDVEIDRDENLDDSVIAEENQLETIRKLREKLKACDKERMEYLTGWQKAKADFINIRKRDEEAKGEFLKFAKEDIIREILPVLDSFENAFRDKTAWQSVPKEWRSGMESIHNQLLGILGQHGVKKNDVLNKQFDPETAEAIGTIIVDDKGKDHLVLDVLQSAYSLNGKIIRVARVKIGENTDKN